jgi:hypothetical protein
MACVKALEFDFLHLEYSGNQGNEKMCVIAFT